MLFGFKVGSKLVSKMIQTWPSLVKSLESPIVSDPKVVSLFRIDIQMFYQNYHICFIVRISFLTMTSEAYFTKILAIIKSTFCTFISNNGYFYYG